jgi:hypothetical protein
MKILFLKKGIFWLLKPFLVFFVFGIFFFKAKNFIDPDFGWHWRMGEIILEKGIPQTDPFSYTMKSFPFVDHEWLTNIFIYLGDKYLGYNFLVLFFVFIALLGLLIAIENFPKRGFWQYLWLVFFLMGAGAISSFTGVRPQILSWFYLALWLRLILKPKYSFKEILKMGLFILLWANTHGSFALGIFCLGVIFLFRSWQKKKIAKEEGLAFLFCLGLTFLNPYKERLWGEVWLQISDSKLRWRIAEWMPSFFKPIFPFLFLVSWGFFIYQYRQKFEKEILFLFIFFLIEAFLSLRNIPLFVIFSLRIYGKTVNFLEKEIKEKGVQEKRAKNFFLILLSLSLFIFGVQEFVFNYKDLLYPLKAVNFLKKNLPKGEILAPYDWGGYLIWQLPEKKVFIDGRMPSWRWKADLPGESNNAMDDYSAILENEEKLAETLEKYKITTVLWFREDGKRRNIFEEKLANLFFYKLKKPISIEAFLRERKWEKKYEDELAVVLSKEN